MRMLKRVNGTGSLIQEALARGYELASTDESMGCTR